MSQQPAEAVAATHRQILPLRQAYCREMNCQIVHDSWHARGFLRSHLLRLAGDVVGYASAGAPPSEEGCTIKEFYVLPRHRVEALRLFRLALEASGADAVEAQTNDRLLLLMLLDTATNLRAERLLFADAEATDLRAPGCVFRPLPPEERERVFAHEHEPVGEYGLQVGGVVVATGGWACHYNPPYADLYMEVHAPHRRRGLGAYLVQQSKRVCREAGYEPAARCAAANVASRRTLERAGLFPCARIVRGDVPR